MTALLADLGGTNVRLALYDGYTLRDAGRIPDTKDLGHAIAAYLAHTEAGPISGAVLAVAGPVIHGHASLTNRPWTLTEAELTAQIGAPARLINDMVALALALHHLPENARISLRAAGPLAPDNGQALVVNAGTGFNVAGVRRHGPRPPWLWESESGHAMLPCRVMDRLRADLGAAATRFDSIESLLSGPGLAQLHEMLTGQPAAGFAKAAASGQADATLDRAAGYLGIVCADLAARHWPGRGLWLAGSPARAMAARRAAFLEGLAQPGRMAPEIADMPVHVITDDLAALRGCAAALSEI